MKLFQCRDDSTYLKVVWAQQAKTHLREQPIFHEEYPQCAPSSSVIPILWLIENMIMIMHTMIDIVITYFVIMATPQYCTGY